MDDFLLTGSNDAGHLKTLRMVLQRFRESGIKLKKKKCIVEDQVEFLGCLINKHGTRKNSDKVLAAAEIRRSENVSKLKAFLGSAN